MTTPPDWRPEPELEELRKLRNSDDPAKRAVAEQQIVGTRRIGLGLYEQALAAHLAAGNPLPENVEAL